MKKIFYFGLLLAAITACNQNTNTEAPVVDSTKIETTDTTEQETLEIHHRAVKATTPVNINGLADEDFWNNASWNALDQIWLGDTNLTPEDFTGKFKLAWDENQLYVLVEVIDDSLTDTHEDKFTQWWDDDCVEIFVDEDNSDEWHQFNHTAFAYHVGLNYDVVDLGPDSLPHLYNDHVTAQRTFENGVYTWECAVKLFDKSFVDDGDNSPRKLKANEIIGFALAYCDNDKSETRENFIASIPVYGEDKDQGWKRSEVFGNALLEE